MSTTTQPTNEVQYLNSRNWGGYWGAIVLSVLPTIFAVNILPTGLWTHVLGLFLYSVLAAGYAWSICWYLMGSILVGDGPEYEKKKTTIKNAYRPILALAAGATFFSFPVFYKICGNSNGRATIDGIDMAGGCAIVFACWIVLGAAACIIGAPRLRNTRAPASHIGGLRGSETLLRGASVVPAPAILKVNPGQLFIGNVPLKWEDEVQHQLISGMNGTGKTQIINAQLAQIREREKDKTRKIPRAIILDNAGGFYSRFGRPGDILLNPFDKRSVAWSPFAEIKRVQDFPRIASAFIPQEEGPGQRWTDFSRTVFADTMRAMIKKGEKNPRKLFRLLDGPPEILTEYLESVGIYGLSGRENGTMFANAKSGMAPFIKVLEFLKEDGNFSIRDWVREGDGKPGWLFVTYNDDQMKFLKQFVSVIADLALVEGLSLTSNEGLPEGQHRRLFYILDELDSLGAIGELKDLLSKVRKYGGCCVLSMQVISQMYSTFGRDVTQTIVGNIFTRTVLRPADGETAEAMEKLLGKQEVERRTYVENFSKSNHGNYGLDTSTSRSESEQINVETRPVVLASQLQAMPNLEGILMRPGSPHHHVKVQYKDWPRINEPYLEDPDAGLID